MSSSETTGLRPCTRQGMAVGVWNSVIVSRWSPTSSHAFTCRVTCGEVFEIGAGPLGERHCYTMTGGRIDGDSLSGDLVGPGSDWMVMVADGRAPAAAHG